MSKRIVQLNQMRENLMAEQGVIFSQIMADAKDPSLASSLVVRLLEGQSRYDELARAMSDALAKESKLPAWLQVFSR